jgi:hypothetical protein
MRAVTQTAVAHAPDNKRGALAIDHLRCCCNSGHREKPRVRLVIVKASSDPNHPQPMLLPAPKTEHFQRTTSEARQLVSSLPFQFSGSQ